MTSISTIVLQYRRLPELVNDEHEFESTLQLLDAWGNILHARDVPRCRFHVLMTEVSRDLRESPEAHVVLQRTERPGIPALTVSEDLRVMLRDDPVSAIAAMNIKVGSKAGGLAVRHSPSAFDGVAELFGERVYIRMRNGMFEDPLTGTWLTAAFSDSRKAWLIRAEDNRSDSWLSVHIPSFEGTSIDVSDGMGPVVEELARSCWATVSVEDLLLRNVNKYFLPRMWNTAGQWVSRTELRGLLDAYNINKKETES